MHIVPSPLNPPSNLPVDIDDLVVSTLGEHGAPGCSVAVSHRDLTWVGGYGLARVEPALSFLPDTRVPVASMSKPFTATAVMALVEAGVVDLDAPVRRYLPGFRVADSDASEQTTVRHLLTHRTGWLGDEPDLVTDRGDSALAAQVDAFASLPQMLPPGTTFSYSNTGMNVAGRLVEVVGGESYESIIERTILNPLGLTHSTFFAERVVSAPAASGHLRTPEGTMAPVQDGWFLPRGVNPSGGLISSARDQLRWMRWWLGALDDDVAGPVAARTRTQMISELTPIESGRAATGLGWHVDHLRRSSAATSGEVNVVYHEGGLPGIATVCRFVPDADLAVVVLTNDDEGQHVFRTISKRLLAELADIHEPDQLIDENVDEAILVRYAGTYRSPEQQGKADSVEVVAHEGTLGLTVRTVHFDEPLSMTAGRVDDDLFALVGGPWADQPVEFLPTSSGELLGLRVAGRFFPRDGAAG